MKHILSLVLLTLSGLASAKENKPSLLIDNARVAIIGDSITEQKLYSKYIETYLLACTGRKDIRCFQFGWGGETAGGFKQRLENDLSVFSPTVATTCYGMNDGRYVPFAEAVGKDYEANMRAVVTGMQRVGVKSIVVGTPGAVDTRYFVKAGASADQYNDSLARLGGLGHKLSGEFHTGFADVHREMTEAMTKAKAALGADYDVCGRDGVHPGPNGHLLMAAAILKGLGCDGDIGTITADMQGTSTTTDGHKLLSQQSGALQIESTTWPFCFDGDAKSPGGTRSILAFCKFNDELNRLTLQVKNLTAAKAKVTWGTESKEFTRAQLTKGINLAAEFTKTPFDAAFTKLIGAVGAKQGYETPMIKGMITNFRNFAADAKADPEFAGALEVLKKKMLAKQEMLDADARKLVVPVKHTIKIEAAN